MPTVIALDTSLSMQRKLPGRNDENSLTFQQLAQKGISHMLEYLTGNCKLESVALVTYTNTCDLKVDFTRDYELIRQAVKKVEAGLNTNFEQMLKTVSSLLSTNWGTQCHLQVVVFTDCSAGIGKRSLEYFKENLITHATAAAPELAWLKMLKPYKLIFVCMGVQSDSVFTRTYPVLQKILEVLELKGKVFTPKPKDATEQESSVGVTGGHLNHKSELGRTAMFELMERVCDYVYKPFDVTLKCGSYFRLESVVQLWPPPQPYEQDEQSATITISQIIEVCGYFALTDIGSPTYLSRHLVTPRVEREKLRRGAAKLKPLDTNHTMQEQEKLEQAIRDFYLRDTKENDEPSAEDVEANSKHVVAPAAAASQTNAPPESQRENLCVLLYACLKAENMAALMLLNDNWYGFLHAGSDNNKKKANLLLTILLPGNNVVPWLGDFNKLGFPEDLQPGETSVFPLKADKRSYSQNCVVWITKSSLQSDVQKVLRHAKKMPEKMQHFYKELNRIRRAAISIGFIELLEAMATLFEKEAGYAKKANAPPECAVQLQHAAFELRKLNNNRDLKVSIMPFNAMAVPTATGFY